MPKTKVEVYDKDQLIYPFIESDHVTFSNGMKITEMLDQSISMPTVTHEDLSFKVGVGDQDVSSSVVDSTVNMTIKGQTYQNILPEPTLRNEMQGKSMQRLNEGYDNIEVVDGVSKSAILKGQTLVNVNKMTYPTTWYTNPNNNNYYRDNLTLRSGMVKSSTKYLLKIYGLSKPNEIRLQGVSGVFASSESQWRFSVNGGLIVTTVASVQEVENLTPHFKRDDVNNLTDKEMQDFKMIILEYQEGMENWDIPYFEGMTSCKMPVLCTTTSQNLSSVPFSFFEKTTDRKYGAWTIFEFDNLFSGKIILNKRPFNTIMYFDTKENRLNTGTTVVKDVQFIGFHNPSTNIENNNKGNLLELLKSGELDISLQENGKTNVYSYKKNDKTNILSCQLAPLNQTMFEQGTFAETTPPNTQSYEQIKLGSEHLYTTRIRTKGTYKVVKGATYEVQLNDGYGIYVCYCKNGLYSATVNRWLDGTSTFTVPSDCDEMFFAIRKTDNTTIAPSDYPHIGLKIHQKVVLRSLPNGVTDTLNINTGEYVQRIGEVTLNGSEEWGMDNEASDSKENTSIFYSRSFTQFKKLEVNERNSGIVCNGYPVKGDVYGSDVEGMMFNHVNVFYFRVKKSVANNVGDFKQWLSQNPKEVQLELATPIVKTVDLSSSGNWEKVILDGKSSEDWKQNSHSGNFVQFEGYSNFCLYSMNLPVSNRGLLCDKLSYYGYDSKFRHTKVEGISDGGGYRLIFVRVKTEKLPTNDVAGFKQWLSQNPTTVWYQTTTTQDNSIREMLSFANGHLQVSSEAENSLLPSVQYEIPTKNSYHMDLMKTNTLYTMKAKTVSGTFTIDGTSYNVNANGTFTSPSSMTDKLLVMSNRTNEEVMLLEGNVIDKTIPYFKGIKSAFEDEDKIEVLSTSHNLWTGVDNYTNSGATIILKDENECIFEHHKVNDGIKVKVEDYEYQVITMSYDFEILDGEALNVGGHSRHETKAFYIDGVKATEGYHNGHVATYQNNRVYHVDHVVHINLPMGQGNVVGEREYIGIEPNRYSADTPTYCKMRVTNFQITLGNTIKGYASPKSNSTKIPLLSPLRSLPNGVCDELIINRMKKKATLIQRIKTVTLDGSSDERWTGYNDDSARVTQGFYHNVSDLVIARANVNLYCDTLQPNINAIHSRDGRGVGTHNDGSNNRNIRLCLLKNELIPYGFSEPLKTNENVLRKWLQDNPTTVCYELATPVVTEVDLEGYPYIYKDGHIFLNSDIAPTTQITYSINQAQQIESANENLQRHEKEISRLQKLIAQYIQVEYESTLLSLKI